MSRRYLGGFISASLNPLLQPNAPTIGTATAGNAQASVTFTASTTGSPTSYTAVSIPGGFTGTSATSPVTVTGLSNGTAYTFVVFANNAYGPSAASAASNSVTPVAPPVISDVYSTTLYTGNGSSQTVTNGLNLPTKGGLTWIKSRSASGNNRLFDTTRTSVLSSNTASAQSNGYIPDYFNFISNGFSIPNTITSFINDNGTTYASWTFAKQAKFFDIVTYTGNGSSSQTINHNLGSVPGMIIVKSTDGPYDWAVYHRSLGATQYLTLNAPDPANSGSIYWANTAPTSTTFTVAQSGATGANSTNYVAYLFAHDAGGFGPSGTDSVISCGSYTGDGSAPGPTVTVGFEPQWLLIKRASTSNGGWVLIDSARGMSPSGVDSYLQPNNTDAESTTEILSPTSTGFQINSVNTMWNTNGTTFVYMAIRKP